MKTIKQLIEEDTNSPPPKDKPKHNPHPVNLIMNFNGGRRGRKTDKEREDLKSESNLKVKNQKVYLYFD
tara:strand:+ start:802 stop:1008 length:207 start_codon:yes stop_codon:yes gene_type:complete